MRVPRSRFNGRQEVMWLALAAAEVCWLAPFLLGLEAAMAPHPPLLLWLGMLLLLLAFFYLYRAVEAASLPLRAQQAVLVLVLLLSIALFLRYHIFGDPQWRGGSWLVALVRGLVDADAVQPGGWVAAMALVYFWARGIHLARRSMSLQSVGFSFRSGVLVLVIGSVFLTLLTRIDASAFVIPYFFFSLVAVALARIEEVSQMPNSSRTGFSGFWIGSTLVAVGLLVLLGMGLALFFYGGGLQRVIDWLWPAVVLLELIVVGIGVLFLAIVEYLLSLFSLDLDIVGQGLWEVLESLRQMLAMLSIRPPPGSDAEAHPSIAGLARGILAIGIPLTVIGLVLLLTWYRRTRAGGGDREESRESTFSTRLLAASLQAALQDGLARLGELAGLVDRFGLGSRFLAALSVRRIYANMVRLAADAGYPRGQSQTPYEYIATLALALPGSEDEVRAITEAYVAAHYGQVPDTREELQRLRECWQRIRAAGIEAT